MAKGSSSNQQKQETRTDIRTTTNTNIRDIGLTGKDAVNLAYVLGQVDTQNTATAAALVDRIVQEQGAGYKQLVGGAGVLVETARGFGEKLLDTAKTVVTGATTEADKIRASATMQAAGENPLASEIAKNIPLIVAAAGVVSFVILAAKAR